MSKHLLSYTLNHIHIKDNRPDTLYHWHPEVEVIFVESGSARYHIDYDIFNSQSGDIILVSPNSMHSIHPIPNSEQKSTILNFHLDMLGQNIVNQTSLHYLQPLQSNKCRFISKISTEMSGYQEIKECLQHIFNIIQQEDRHFELLLKSKIHEFIYLLFFHRHINKKISDDVYRKNAKIRAVIDYMNEHYQEAITIERLSNLVGYSHTHLISLFKEHVGYSCMDFLISVRLQKAPHLLTNSHDPILEIATQCGFTNLSNFNRQFKKHFNMSPRTYRQNHNTK